MFTLAQCDARLKFWRRRLAAGDCPALEAWANIDRLLDVRPRLVAGERVEKPWETTDPVPDGA